MTGPRDLSSFAGVWTLRRRIEDAQAGSELSGEGQAVLERDGDHLVYRETLALRFPGRPAIMGTRRYRWQADDTGIEVRFEDGRAFHRFDLDGPAAAGAHWCDPDQYDVTYHLTEWPRWHSVWTVSGPRKRYRMTTWYKRSEPT